MLNMARQGTVPVIVLFYHRVADEYPNDWSMTRAEFQQQIEWFEENFEIVDLQECQRRIASGNNSRPTLAITFDDGYAENSEFALPLLIERKIPATYFVTTYHTTEQKPFPHDVQRGRPLPVNSIASLLAMDMAGIEIAAHSRTHPDIGSITDPRQLVDEVIASSIEMESLIGRKIRYFAFPFGQPCNLHRDVFAMLKEAGFLGVCSAYGGWNEIGEDPFHLQRIHGDPNIQRMKNWLTFDPRVGRVDRYDYRGGTVDQELLQSTIEAARLRDGQPPAADRCEESTPLFPTFGDASSTPSSFTPTQ
ncbi:MAG: polysaccharide deacetylase family protein [Planctomycetota bacterium]